MDVLEKLNVGIVGACGRGVLFARECASLDRLRPHALCDINAECLAELGSEVGASETYVDYETMLEQSELDAVIIATPMHLHVTQAVPALEMNLHVLSEVTAGISVEECKRLVAAAQASSGTYMLAENYIYMKPNAMIREIVQRGLFGTPYYAEGEYLHELKELNERTPWRRTWHTGIEGITYGTHSLGPILQWMPNDRVVSVCCAGSGHHHRDPRGDEYAQDTSVMLCKMRSDGLVKIRLDVLSDRPYATTNYQLQGTDGCYESSRVPPGVLNRIWLRSYCDDPEQWLDLNDLEDEFLPAMWRDAPLDVTNLGHYGGDYFAMIDFVGAIEGEHPPTVGIHEAMDMTLPGLISQQSAIEDGRWIEVPDSRLW